MKQNICPDCGVLQTEENSQKRKDTKKLSFKTRCNICEAEYWRKFREANREKLRQAANIRYKEKIPFKISDFKSNPKLYKLYQDIKRNGYKLQLPLAFWSDFNEKEIEIFKELVFIYYRKYHGFPETVKSTEQQLKEIQEFNRIKNNKQFIINNEIQVDRHYLTDIHYSYFDMMSMTNAKISPIDAFNNDQILRKVIDFRICKNKWTSGIGDRYLLKDLKTGLNSKTFANFRPTAAYAIYNKYCPENATVWDMSGGWGGRYLGALLCEKVQHYFATEPSTKTHSGLLRMSLNLVRPGFTSDFCMIGSEDFTPMPNSLDICFTSPPYFNCERYSDEPTQSYIKFPEPQMWMSGFLEKTIDNCEIGLKPGGYLILNIADVSTYKTLCSDFQEMMKTKNFDYVETLKYLMPSRKGGQKFEPIFIYKKRG